MNDRIPVIFRFAFSPRSWVGVLAVAAVLALPNAARASSFNSVSLFGTDYVDCREFAARYGLTAKWVERNRTMRLQSKWTTIDLAVHQRDLSINGVRLYLSEPIVAQRGSLFLSEGDAETVLDPVLVPHRVKPLRAVKTVVIDAGHGGNDPGKQNTRLKLSEKNLTLDVARRLERLLKDEGFSVVMTRRTDRRVELDRRAEIATKARADLFISIHFNSFTSPSVDGAETFIMTPLHERSSPSAERDRRMAQTKYPGNRYDHWNALLGYKIHRNIVTRLKAPDRGLKRFRYHVLRTVNCPAVLVEAAFLSNTTEARKAGSASYRQKLAEALERGIKDYAAAVARAI